MAPAARFFYKKTYLLKKDAPLAFVKIFYIFEKMINEGGSMKVYFDNKDLELYATEERAALKALGKLRANLYRRRTGG